VKNRDFFILGKMLANIFLLFFTTKSVPWPAPVALLVRSVIGESGFEARAGRIIASGYSGVTML